MLQGIRLLSQLGGSNGDAAGNAISSLDRLLHELQPESLHDARCALPPAPSHALELPHLLFHIPL
jgi:hypothetical protein